MSNAQPAIPDDDHDRETKTTASLVEQIVDATLADRRVTERVSAPALVEVRATLLTKTLAKPHEVVAAANHEEQSGETA